MGISNYPNGWANGVIVRGNPIDIRQAGDSAVFWVDSGRGSNGNKGTYLLPFETIDYAIGQCSANRGDVIYVAAGHAETVASAAEIAVDIAGISIIGLGEGDDAPTLTFSAADSTVLISAANVNFMNFKLVPSIDSVVSPLAITGDDCTILVQNVDASSTVECVRAVLATGVNRGHFMVQYIGDIGGNACVNGVQLINCSDIRIDCDFYGLASTAWVEFLTTACSNINIFGYMYNSGTTDHTKDIIDTATGSTWWSKFEDGSEGASISGGSGAALGSDDVSTISSQITDLQADVGDPSSRTNFQNLEDMIGIPDAANSDLNDMLNTGFDSSALTANQDGSIMERLEYVQENIIPDVGMLAFKGTCDIGMGASTTVIVSDHLTGYGDDFFNTKYYIQVLKNANSVGNAPETQVRQITDYVSATGTFTCTAFGANVEASDEIAVLHESLVIIGRDDADNTIATTNVVANADGSLLERDQYNQAAISVIDGYQDVPTADVADNAQMRDVVGNKTDAAAAGAVSAVESLMAYIKQNVTANIAIQADVGDASARTNLQNLEDMLGNPDSASATIHSAIINTLPSVGNSKLGVRVQRAANVDLAFDNNQVAVFTVAGGRVLIMQLSLEVATAAVAAAACLASFVTNPTVGTDAAMCATLNVTGDESGSIYSITGEVGTALTGGSGGGASAMISPVIVAEGTIDRLGTVDATAGGHTVAAECWYIPLDDGATVVAT